METLLDDSVGQKVELQIERGGTPLTVELLVSVYFNVEISMISVKKKGYILLHHSCQSN